MSFNLFNFILINQGLFIRIGKTGHIWNPEWCSVFFKFSLYLNRDQVSDKIVNFSYNNLQLLENQRIFFIRNEINSNQKTNIFADSSDCLTYPQILLSFWIKRLPIDEWFTGWPAEKVLSIERAVGIPKTKKINMSEIRKNIFLRTD